MGTRLSVVIPCLNEAATLPGLLGALRKQTRPPDEIVVADAGSTDETRSVAESCGAKVVDGGRPAAGRNAGARSAAGDLILFLDADVLPGLDFVERMLREFEYLGYDVATCLIEPLSDRLADRISADATNVYLQVVQPFSPHAPGFCILVRSELHDRIGGFDETLALAEDHDYVQRAARIGRFGLLTRVRIPVSMRRLDSEGLPGLALKYMWCEMHALAGRPIREIPFAYEFGSHGEPAERSHRLVDVSRLRDQLGRIENPIAELSGHATELVEDALRRDRAEWREVFRGLEPPDLARLQRYLRRRRALTRVTRREARRRLAALGSSPRGEWLVMLLGGRDSRKPKRDR